MPHFDLPLDELRRYRSAVAAPDDLSAYWEDALAAARAARSFTAIERYRPDAYGRLRASRSRWSTPAARAGGRPATPVTPARVLHDRVEAEFGDEMRRR